MECFSITKEEIDALFPQPYAKPSNSQFTGPQTSSVGNFSERPVYKKSPLLLNIFSPEISGSFQGLNISLPVRNKKEVLIKSPYREFPFTISIKKTSRTLISDELSSPIKTVLTQENISELTNDHISESLYIPVTNSTTSLSSTTATIQDISELTNDHISESLNLPVTNSTTSLSSTAIIQDISEECQSLVKENISEEYSDPSKPTHPTLVLPWSSPLKALPEVVATGVLSTHTSTQTCLPEATFLASLQSVRRHISFLSGGPFAHGLASAIDRCASEGSIPGWYGRAYPSDIKALVAPHQLLRENTKVASMVCGNVTTHVHQHLAEKCQGKSSSIQDGSERNMTEHMHYPSLIELGQSKEEKLNCTKPTFASSSDSKTCTSPAAVSSTENDFPENKNSKPTQTSNTQEESSSDSEHHLKSGHSPKRGKSPSSFNFRTPSGIVSRGHAEKSHNRKASVVLNDRIKARSSLQTHKPMGSKVATGNKAKASKPNASKVRPQRMRSTLDSHSMTGGKKHIKTKKGKSVKRKKKEVKAPKSEGRPRKEKLERQTKSGERKRTVKSAEAIEKSKTTSKERRPVEETKRKAKCAIDAEDIKTLEKAFTKWLSGEGVTPPRANVRGFKPRVHWAPTVVTHFIPLPKRSKSPACDASAHSQRHRRHRDKHRRDGGGGGEGGGGEGHRRRRRRASDDGSSDDEKDDEDDDVIDKRKAKLKRRSGERVGSKPRTEPRRPSAESRTPRCRERSPAADARRRRRAKRREDTGDLAPPASTRLLGQPRVHSKPNPCQNGVGQSKYIPNIVPDIPWKTDIDKKRLKQVDSDPNTNQERIQSDELWLKNERVLRLIDMEDVHEKCEPGKVEESVSNTDIVSLQWKSETFGNAGRESSISEVEIGRKHPNTPASEKSLRVDQEREDEGEEEEKGEDEEKVEEEGGKDKDDVKEGKEEKEEKQKEEKEATSKTDIFTERNCFRNKISPSMTPSPQDSIISIRESISEKNVNGGSLTRKSWYFVKRKVRKAFKVHLHCLKSIDSQLM